MGLVAGRSQREKRRSYKDLLREEEEIDAQVRKTSKKRRVRVHFTCDVALFLYACLDLLNSSLYISVCLQDSDPFAAGNELHKKKKRTHEDENYHHKGDIGRKYS